MAKQFDVWAGVGAIVAAAILLLRSNPWYTIDSIPVIGPILDPIVNLDISGYLPVTIAAAFLAGYAGVKLMK